MPRAARSSAPPTQPAATFSLVHGMWLAPSALPSPATAAATSLRAAASIRTVHRRASIASAASMCAISIRLAAPHSGTSSAPAAQPPSAQPAPSPAATRAPAPARSRATCPLAKTPTAAQRSATSTRPAARAPGTKLAPPTPMSSARHRLVAPAPARRSLCTEPTAAPILNAAPQFARSIQSAAPSAGANAA